MEYSGQKKSEMFLVIWAVILEQSFKFKDLQFKLKFTHKKDMNKKKTSVETKHFVNNSNYRTLTN